jgi:hypothetical protein
MSIFAKDFSAGTITLGGNGDCGSGCSMYTVIIVGSGGNPGSLPPEAPTGLRIID